jgi:hypothetical protein
LLHLAPPLIASKIELTLLELGYGYDQVYPFVGRNTQVYFEAVGRDVYPLVTGTFAGADVYVSILGEIQDKLGHLVLFYHRAR